MDRFTNIKNYETTIKELESFYKNNNTIKTWIVKIINELKKKEPKVKNEIMIKYREELERLQILYVEEKKTKVPTEKQKENYIPLEKLREIWLDSYEDTYEFFVLGLYIWLPAKRTDYVNLTLKKNKDGLYYFHLPKQIKVNQNKSVDIEIPEELEQINYEDYVIRLRKTSNNSLVKQIKRYSKKIFEKEISINLFRKLWVDYIKNTDNSLDSRINLSNDMNHSIYTSKDIYEIDFEKNID